MTPLNVGPLPVAVLDAHLLSDDAVRRLAGGSTSLVSFATFPSRSADLIARAAVLGLTTPVEDGGIVDDVRAAIVACAQRGILVIGAPTPAHADRFVAHCLQGAAAATEFDVPGVAVHVLRDQSRPGTVAWLTDTGELSGYGVLFAVGYAALHGTGVDLIEPAGGTSRPRTPEAIDGALAQAERLGVSITRHTDPSPMARVLRDPHCIVVHPVLDAPTGFNLLHHGELPHKAVSSGNPAVVVELLEQFPGDVVAVYDGVHLIGGGVDAARIAAGAALGVVGIAGLGIVAAPAAMADSHHGSYSTSSSAHEPSGNHYGWCKNPHNPHHDGEGCGEMPVGWMGSVVPHGPSTQAPEKTPDPVVVVGTPGSTHSEISDTTGPQRTPTMTPPEYQNVPVPVPQQTPPVTQQAPTLVPPLPSEQKVPTPTPQQTPPVTQQAPTLVPPLPTEQKVPTPVPTAVPTPVTTQQAPTLVPPLRGPVTETTQTAVPSHVVTTETPTEVGPQVVMPGTTTDQVVPTSVDGGVVPTVTDQVVPTSTGTSTPGSMVSTPDAQAPVHTGGQHNPSRHTRHASDPGHVTEHQSQDGTTQLAHTGGNAAILAIVAGSLLAAGAGVAVASRVGKDGEADKPTEG